MKTALFKLSPQAKLYLFGSRIDDNRQGGDMDLMVVSDCLTKKDISRLRIEFFKKLGEKKLGILLDDGLFTPVFHRLIMQKAQQLWWKKN